MAQLIMNVAKALARLPKGTKALLASAAGLVVILWPRKANAPTYITNAQRDAWFGPIRYAPDPTPDNAEGIRITNDFPERNIITHAFPLIGVARIHRLAAPSLQAALQEIQSRGLGAKIRSFEGGYYPRFVRGSNSSLSSHSYGTSIDINAPWNPQGGAASLDQESIAPIFEKHGWYWGKRFSTRTDPMHFEYVLPPKGVTA